MLHITPIPIPAGAAGHACRDTGDHEHDLNHLWRAMTGRHGHGPGRHGPGQRGPGGGPRGFPFGGGGPGGFPFGPGGGRGRRGPRARRGDVRTAALLLLAEEPRNGYQIMQELEERSEGAWRPSAGSVYPALQQLEDEGLVRSDTTDGRKLLELTDAGRKLVDARDEAQPAPWEQLAGDVSDEWRTVGTSIRAIMGAITQVMQTGDEAQRAEARRLLATTQRGLYRILAGPDDSAAPDDAGSGDEPPQDAAQ